MLGVTSVLRVLSCLVLPLLAMSPPLPAQLHRLSYI